MQPLGKQPAHHPLSSSNKDVEENGPVRAPASAINTIMGRLGLAREQNESEADEAALARDLADSSWAVRVEAVQKLGKIGKQAPLGLLLVGLNDEQSSVRAAAARALARNPRQAALPALVIALGDTEWVVRAEVAMALGKLQELAPLESLLAVLKDKDATVRAAAVEALGDLGSESTLEPLQEALRDEDWSVREAATLALDRVKSQAVLSSPHDPCENTSDASEASAEARSPDVLSPPSSDSFARWLARIESYEANTLAGEVRSVPPPVFPPTNHARGSQSASRPSIKQQKRKKRLARYVWPRKLARLAEGLLAAIMIACLLIAWVIIQPRPHPTQVGSSGNNSGNAPAFTIYHGHESSVERLAWSPDGHTIASADARGGLQVWQASSGHTLFTYQQRGEILALTWSNPNQVLAAYGEQNKTLQVLAFTIGTVERTQTLFQRTRLPGIPSVAAWAPNSQTLAFDTGNGSIEIWSVRINFNVASIIEKRTGYAELAWSPDSSQLATVSTTGELKIWDAFTGQNLFTLTGGQQATLAAWISSGQDGDHLFFINVRGDIMECWCRQSYQGSSLFLAAQAYNFASASSSTLSAISLAPGGDQLALATASGSIQTRDATTGNLIYVYTGHSAQVNDVEWAPDGRHIASASMDTTAQVWQEP